MHEHSQTDSIPSAGQADPHAAESSIPPSPAEQVGEGEGGERLETPGSDLHRHGLPTEEPAGGILSGEAGEWEEEEGVDLADEQTTQSGEAGGPVARLRRRRRQPRADAAELRLQGRRELCKRIG